MLQEACKDRRGVLRCPPSFEAPRGASESHAWLSLQKLASLDARARAAGPRGPKPQLYFSWVEDAERTGRSDTDCIDTREESDNLVFEKPYLMNIPVFRRVVPRWSR